MKTKNALCAVFAIVAVTAVVYGASSDQNDYRTAPKLFHRKIRQTPAADNSSFVLDLPYPSHFLFSLQLLNVSLPFLVNVSVPDDPPVPEFNFTDLFKDKPELLKPTEPVPATSSNPSTSTALPKAEEGKPKITRKRNDNRQRPLRNRRPVRSTENKASHSDYFRQSLVQAQKVALSTEVVQNATVTEKRIYPLQSIRYSEYKRTSTAKPTESTTTARTLRTQQRSSNTLLRNRVSKKSGPPNGAEKISSVKIIHAQPIDVNSDFEFPVTKAPFDIEKSKSENEPFLGFRSQSFQPGSTATSSLGSFSSTNRAGSSFSSRIGADLYAERHTRPGSSSAGFVIPRRQKDSFVVETTQRIENFSPFRPSNPRSGVERPEQRRQYFENSNYQQRPFVPSLQFNEETDPREQQLHRLQPSGPPHSGFETKFPGGFSRFSSFQRPNPSALREPPKQSDGFREHVAVPPLPSRFLNKHSQHNGGRLPSSAITDTDIRASRPALPGRFPAHLQESSEETGFDSLRRREPIQQKYSPTVKENLYRERLRLKEPFERPESSSIPSTGHQNPFISDAPHPSFLASSKRPQFPHSFRLKPTEEETQSTEDEFPSRNQKPLATFIAQNQQLPKQQSSDEEIFADIQEHTTQERERSEQRNPQTKNTQEKVQDNPVQLLPFPFTTVSPQSFPLPNLTFPSFDLPGKDGAKPTLPPPLSIDELIKKFTGADPITVPPSFSSTDLTPATTPASKVTYEPTTATRGYPEHNLQTTTPPTPPTSTPADIGLPSLDDLEESLAKLLSSSSIQKAKETRSQNLETAESIKSNVVPGAEFDSKDHDHNRKETFENDGPRISTSTSPETKTKSDSLGKTLTSVPEFSVDSFRPVSLNDISGTDRKQAPPFLTTTPPSRDDPNQTPAPSPAFATTTAASTTESAPDITTETGALSVGNATTVASVQRVLDVSTYEALASIQGNNFGAGAQQNSQQFSVPGQNFGLQQGAGLGPLAFSSNGPNPFILNGGFQQQFNFGDSDGNSVSPTGPNVAGYNAITQGLSLLASFGGGGSGGGQQFNFNNQGNQGFDASFGGAAGSSSLSLYDLNSGGQASSPGASFSLPQQVPQTFSLGQNNQQFPQLSSSNQLSFLLQQQQQSQPQQSFSATTGNTQSSFPLQLLQLQSGRSLTQPSTLGINPAQFGTLLSGTQAGGSSIQTASAQGGTSLAIGLPSLTSSFSSITASTPSAAKGSDTQPSGSEIVEVQAEPPTTTSAAVVKNTDLETSASSLDLVPLGSSEKIQTRAAKKSHAFKGLRSGYYG